MNLWSKLSAINDWSLTQRDTNDGEKPETIKIIKKHTTHVNVCS